MEREELNFLMQKAPADEVKQLCREIESKATIQHIQKPTPQTLLVPVKDPINGGELSSSQCLIIKEKTDFVTRSP